ncbi:sensor histidine kinase [Bacillus taeanensis]|uniref:histidine kinase n=1 Tax=Bacillus taeanensis TaxID=273032 RepID=A0A366XTQ4_9BACI|nr:histidine kinase [Bacillus taeanensis]RBW69750.1 hypothetical protein DS031_09460 [Bacillus taeanensis]
MKLLKKIGIDRTRGQIFFGFIIVMMVVLMLTIGISYLILSKVQKENAVQYIDEIGVQISGRLEALLNEVNVLTLQLATDDRIQEILENELNGPTASFDERMAMRKILINTSAYSETINEIELFSVSQSIYPVVDKSIEERVGELHVAEANTIQNVGDLVWIGRDPENPNYLIAVRQIRLEKMRYQKGGYLVVQVKPSLIEFIRKDIAEMNGSVIYLLDGENNIISTGKRNTPLLSNSDISPQKNEYVTIKKTIEAPNWTLEILMPKKEVTKGVEFLQFVLILSSILSVILFSILSYYLSLFITSPIKRLTQVMQSGKNGVLTENPDYYFNREMNQLNRMYNKMVRQINYLFKSVYEKEIMKNKSEIKALHSQINPHFLFNTLDSLYWSLIGKGEKELSKFVITLANLFRYTIQSNGQEGFVSIEEEIEQVKRYTDIMKMRFHDRLHVEIDANQNTKQYKIPKLTIQPLIENAIIHGIEPKGNSGVVKLIVKEEKGVILFIINDDGIGMKEERVKEIQMRLRNEENHKFISKGTGIGLFNIHKLIQLHYGEEFGLEINSHLNKGTTVGLRIPARS